MNQLYGSTDMQSYERTVEVIKAACEALGSINATTLQTITDTQLDQQTRLQGDFSSVLSFDAFSVVPDVLGGKSAQPLSKRSNFYEHGSGKSTVLVVYTDADSARHAPPDDVFAGLVFSLKASSRRLVIAVDWDIQAAVQVCAENSFSLSGVIVVGHFVFEKLELQDALVLLEVPSVVWTCSGSKDISATLEGERADHILCVTHASEQGLLASAVSLAPIVTELVYKCAPEKFFKACVAVLSALETEVVGMRVDGISCSSERAQLRKLSSREYASQRLQVRTIEAKIANNEPVEAIDYWKQLIRDWRRQKWFVEYGAE
jgi:hypothetical protein